MYVTMTMYTYLKYVTYPTLVLSSTKQWFQTKICRAHAVLPSSFTAYFYWGFFKLWTSSQWNRRESTHALSMNPRLETTWYLPRALLPAFVSFGETVQFNSCCLVVFNVSSRHQRHPLWIYLLYIKLLVCAF